MFRHILSCVQCAPPHTVVYSLMPFTFGHVAYAVLDFGYCLAKISIAMFQTGFFFPPQKKVLFKKQVKGIFLSQTLCFGVRLGRYIFYFTLNIAGLPRSLDDGCGVLVMSLTAHPGPWIWTDRWGEFLVQLADGNSLDWGSDFEWSSRWKLCVYSFPHKVHSRHCKVHVVNFVWSTGSHHSALTCLWPISQIETLMTCI